MSFKKISKHPVICEIFKLCTAFVTVFFLDYLFGYVTGNKTLAFIIALLSAILYSVLPNDDSSRVKKFYNNKPILSLFIMLITAIIFCLIMTLCKTVCDLPTGQKETIFVDIMSFFINEPAFLTSSILLYLGASNQKISLQLTPKVPVTRICICSSCAKKYCFQNKKEELNKE